MEPNEKIDTNLILKPSTSNFMMNSLGVEELGSRTNTGFLKEEGGYC